MGEKNLVNQSVKFVVNKALTPTEINSRLEMLSQTALAKEWGVSLPYVCLVFRGQRLFSPLVKKLARKIRTPEPLLRGVLSDRAHLLNEQKLQQSA